MAVAFTPAPIQEPLNTNISQSPGWVSWFKLVRLYIQGFTSISDADQDLVTNTTFYATSSALQTFTVPSRFNVNDTIQVIGVGPGGWKIQLGVGQTIVGDGTTTSGGSLASTVYSDTVTLKGSVANTVLSITSKVGTLTYA